MTIENTPNEPTATDKPIATPEAGTPPTETPPTETQKQLFPDNWHELMSNNDDDKKLLAKYASPKEVSKALLEANKKISQRFDIKKPTETATEEEVNNWRKAWGIPEAPDKYELKLSEGRQLSEHDKPIINDFIAEMHKTHATPEVVNKAIDKYYEIQEKQLQAIEELNKQDKQALEEDLRQEYGRNYTANISKVDTFLKDKFGNETAEILAKAVGHDGRMLFNNPDFMRGMVNMALQDNPNITMPSGLANIEALEAEQSRIEKSIADGTYYKDANMQARYTQILETKERMKK